MFFVKVGLIFLWLGCDRENKKVALILSFWKSPRKWWKSANRKFKKVAKIKNGHLKNKKEPPDRNLKKCQLESKFPLIFQNWSILILKIPIDILKIRDLKIRTTIVKTTLTKKKSPQTSLLITPHPTILTRDQVLTFLATFQKITQMETST